jgi:pimeloyl-ACP methyl ester carboxylesterase
VEAVGPEEVVLVGHPMGGTVAISAALHLGGRVKGVVWVDTYKRLGSPRSPEEIQKVLAPFKVNFRDTTEAYVRGMFPPGADETLVRRVAGEMAATPPAIAVSALEGSMVYARTITEAERSGGADHRHERGTASPLTCRRCKITGCRL